MKETTKMEKEKELEKKQIESPEQAGSAPRRKPSRPKLKPQRSSVAQPRPKDGGRFERPIPVIGPSRVIPGQLGQRQGEPRPGEPATRPIQAMKSMANSNIHITFTMPASKAKALPKKQVLPKKLLPTSKPLAKPRGSVAHHMDALTSPPPKPQIRPTRAKPKAKPKAAPKASAGSEQLSKTAKMLGLTALYSSVSQFVIMFVLCEWQMVFFRITLRTRTVQHVLCFVLRDV